MKKLLKLTFLGILIIALALVIPNYMVKNNAKNKVYNSVSEIPKNKVGLVLGASKFVASGRINLYYKFRVDATAKLYKAGKIDFVLVSGDNGIEDYDEPTTFKEDLMTKGIPENKIFLDYAGFRTLDSVIRAKEIFSLSEITFISQEFHNERAIYLAEKNNIHAIGFNAQDITGKYRFKTKLRERFARTKAVIDILFNVQPKFLGKKIEIK